MKRLPAVSVLAVCAQGALAQSALDLAKGEVTSAPVQQGPSLGLMPLIQMMVAIGIVLGLVKFLLPRLAGRLNKRLSTPIGSQIRIEDSATFAGGTLHIVEVRGKALLLSVGTQGVTCLADVTEPKAADTAAPTFMEVLENAEAAMESAPAAVAAVRPRPAGNSGQPADVEEALRRLSALSQ
ncbi:MAG TPA: flagellar biosynthetic protein FliO [Fimbriimonadaceae bacterium]|nr:flagellar biosynthetic protein FliO [Fimbriimonadaceae bacterium]